MHVGIQGLIVETQPRILLLLNKFVFESPSDIKSGVKLYILHHIAVGLRNSMKISRAAWSK